MELALDVLYIVASLIVSTGFIGWGVAHNKIKKADIKGMTQVAFTKEEWFMISKADTFVKSGVILWIIWMILTALKNYN